MTALLIDFLITDAAVAIGDPNRTRISTDNWTSFYNRSIRELCEKAKVKQYRAKFNLGAQALYPYPDEMTVFSRVEVSETPDNDDTWRKLGEYFEDEFDDQTRNHYPIASMPTHYFAGQEGFYLVPRPETVMLNSGKMVYYGLPDRILTLAGAYFDLPQIAQDYVIRRLIIYGKMARNRIAEAEAELRQWITDLEGLNDRLEDRSDDRRASLQPRKNPYSGMN